MAWCALRRRGTAAVALLAFQPHAAAGQDVFELHELAPGIHAAEVVRWEARYGVSTTAFTAAMRTAVARARLEQESR